MTVNATSENMVLRTVYLPRFLDTALRDLAFRKGVSKGEFMRELIQDALGRLHAAGERTYAEEAAERVPISESTVEELAPQVEAESAKATLVPAE